MPPVLLSYKYANLVGVPLLLGLSTHTDGLCMDGVLASCDLSVQPSTQRLAVDVMFHPLTVSDLGSPWSL